MIYFFCQLFISGTLKIWNVKKSKCVNEKFMGLGLKTDSESTSQTVTQSWYTESSQTVTVVLADHTISIYNLDNLQLYKQVSFVSLIFAF